MLWSSLNSYWVISINGAGLLVSLLCFEFHGSIWLLRLIVVRCAVLSKRAVSSEQEWCHDDGICSQRNVRWSQTGSVWRWFERCWNVFFLVLWECFSEDQCRMVQNNAEGWTKEPVKDPHSELIGEEIKHLDLHGNWGWRRVLQPLEANFIS